MKSTSRNSSEETGAISGKKNGDGGTDISRGPPLLREERFMTSEVRKGKRKIPRQVMAEQEPLERIANFYEVPYGFSEDQAINEAMRASSARTPNASAAAR